MPCGGIFGRDGGIASSLRGRVEPPNLSVGGFGRHSRAFISFSMRISCLAMKFRPLRGFAHALNYARAARDMKQAPQNRPPKCAQPEARRRYARFRRVATNIASEYCVAPRNFRLRAFRHFTTHFAPAAPRAYVAHAFRPAPRRICRPENPFRVFPYIFYYVRARTCARGHFLSFDFHFLFIFLFRISSK